MAKPHKAGAAREIGRMEAFSDGVFAIAITLPIVELQTPTIPAGSTLVGAIEQQWPTYLAYALSFLVIGVYWLAHRRFFAMILEADPPITVLNLIFLALVGLLPDRGVLDVQVVHEEMRHSPRAEHQRAALRRFGQTRAHARQRQRSLDGNAIEVFEEFARRGVRVRDWRGLQ